MPGTIFKKGAELRAIGAAHAVTELPDLALGGLNLDLRCPVQLVPVTVNGHTIRRAGLRARRASLRSVFEANDRLLRSSLWRSFDDGGEAVGLQGCPTDQCAVDVGAGE